ncbi:hypothetical protein K4F52_010318 [Lecanicillium sp. MT-2017a]|nr:hypothetical protein K4F52_010318 [Lecanicillium sp. MT-2017a]
MAPAPVMRPRLLPVAWNTSHRHTTLGHGALHGWRRRMRRTIAFVLFALLGVFAWINFGKLSIPALVRPMFDAPTNRLMAVSMLYGQPEPHYLRALQTHFRHNEKWGYAMHVLETDFAAGYWNKPYYMLALIIHELAKPPHERTEWLMWVDADTIILNSAVPSEIFLPPPDLDDVHFVGTKDHNGLNTGVIFVHVHPWSVSMLTDALAYPKYFPEVDLGFNADQESMARVMGGDGVDPDGAQYRDGVVYLPRPWINAYELAHGYEGKKGSLLVHFPGMGRDRREHMERWLDVVETRPSAWEVPLAQTTIPADTSAFWDMLREAKAMIRSFDAVELGANSSTDISGSDAGRMELRAMREALWNYTGDLERFRLQLERFKAFNSSTTS